MNSEILEHVEGAVQSLSGGVGCDVMRCDEMGWDGMGWDAM